MLDKFYENLYPQLLYIVCH